MFSDTIKSALEKEVVGQSLAVNSVVRGVTRVASGLMPRERNWCAFLFMGPGGTGKTHLIQALARILHGDKRRLIVADCSFFTPGDPWSSFAMQLAPLFDAPAAPNRLGEMGGTSSPFGAPPVQGHMGGLAEAPPLSIILVEYLERGPKELAKALGAVLESGKLMLPGGRFADLRNCLVFITSALCSREILDEAPQIGFSGLQGDEDEYDEQGKLFRTCFEEAEKAFGKDLVGRLDGLIAFHRLEEEHLGDIVDRRFQRLNQWLAPRGIGCTLLPKAKDFLLERGRRDLRLGARDLVRAHRRFVEFPLADLLISRRLPEGGTVKIDRLNGEETLHFTVEADPAGASRAALHTGPHEVPVDWADAPTSV